MRILDSQSGPGRSFPPHAHPRFGDHFPKQSKLAVWAWRFYLLSVVCGLWTLMALTGTLTPLKPPPPDFDIKGNVRLPSTIQIAALGTALGLTVASVWVWHG